MPAATSLSSVFAGRGGAPMGAPPMRHGMRHGAWRRPPPRSELPSFQIFAASIRPVSLPWTPTPDAQRERGALKWPYAETEVAPLTCLCSLVVHRSLSLGMGFLGTSQSFPPVRALPKELFERILHETRLLRATGRTLVHHRFRTCPSAH